MAVLYVICMCVLFPHKYSSRLVLHMYTVYTRSYIAIMVLYVCARHLWTTFLKLFSLTCVM